MKLFTAAEARAFEQVIKEQENPKHLELAGFILQGVQIAIKNGKQCYGLGTGVHQEVKTILEGLGYTVNQENYGYGETVTTITWK